MSALTKIFVVLHVVVSLMLAAALIVFVNRQENFKIAKETAQKDATVAKEQSSLRLQEIQKVKEQLAALGLDKDSQITVLKAEVATHLATIAGKDGEIAQRDSNIQQLNNTVQQANAALAVAQQDLKTRNDAYAALRDQDDKVQKQVVETNTRIAELTNGLEVVTRHDRFMGEQVSQLQADNTRLNEILRKYNISPTGTVPPTGAINSAPSVNINGIVREFKNINGVPFATISLGSADAVTRGMQFKVIDPNANRFLGYLTVDSVNLHDATGRLEGPRVNEVHANVSEVRTQL